MADTNGTQLAPASRGVLSYFSALTSRLALSGRLGWLFDGKRQLAEVFGYKSVLSYGDYKTYYERGDIGQRLVKAYPETTWSQVPTVQESDEKDVETPFEAAWTSLVTRLGVFAKLERADVLANLGQYSVLLIGLRGQSDLARPAQPVRGPDDVLFLTPYSEEFAELVDVDHDTGSPTFGAPMLYRFNFSRSSSSTATLGRRFGRELQGNVHASRVLHLAEDLLDDEVYGIPRLAPVYNKLDDLMKVVGGSAEMFYRDAKRRIALEVQKDFDLSDANAAKITEEAEAYQHGLQDFLRLEGVSAKDLSGIVASPKDHFEVILSLISGTTGIPKRILMGSERGELASSQDERSWLQRVNRRQQQYGEARILRPFIDKLLALGALPAPVEPYQVIWDNLFALGEQEQATVAKDIAVAANTMSPGMPERVVPIPEFRVRYLGLPDEPEYDMLDAPTLPDDEEEDEEDQSDEDEDTEDEDHGDEEDEDDG